LPWLDLPSLNDSPLLDDLPLLDSPSLDSLSLNLPSLDSPLLNQFAVAHTTQWDWASNMVRREAVGQATWMSDMDKRCERATPWTSNEDERHGDGQCLSWLNKHLLCCWTSDVVGQMMPIADTDS
jgi:hypothetical protein